MSELHEEVLDAQTAKVFESIGADGGFADFYLAGGTGLALQIGHRLSIDLDLFSERPWSWERVGPLLGGIGSTRVDREEPGTFVGTVEGVRVSLFHYPYVLLEEPHPTRFGLPVAGLRDIACMKLVALAQRGSRKDFVDLYFLSLEGFTISGIMRDLGRKMPGVEFNPVHVMRSLAFFDDAEAEPELALVRPCVWEDVREYCLHEADVLLRWMEDLPAE